MKGCYLNSGGLHPLGGLYNIMRTGATCTVNMSNADLGLLRFAVQKEQLVARENARQKELEQVAKKRQDELKVKLKKAGVVPLEMERKIDVMTDR